MSEQQLSNQYQSEIQFQPQTVPESEEKSISEEPWFEEFCKFQCGDYYRSFEELNPDLNIGS